MIGIILALAAQTASAGEALWANIFHGMDRAAVEALYPKSGKVEHQPKAIEISDVVILDGCNAEVNVRFGASNTVEEVMIAGDPSMGGRCSSKVLASLSGKYGQPANWDGGAQSFLARQKKVMIWSRPDGTSMTFHKYETGVFGGGGLTKASWELTLRRAPEGFSL